MTATPHKNVYVALSAAQAAMGPLVKDQNNPHFGKKYADLAGVVSVVRGPLTANGLAFFHMVVSADGRDHVRTVLAHGESGTTIECDVPLVVDRNNMQGVKSAVTYAKRVGLESVTGIAPEDDDDGNEAAKAPPRTEAKAPARQAAKAPPPPPDDEADESARRYIDGIITDINKLMTEEDIRKLHAAEAPARKAMGLTQAEVNEIVEACKARIHEIEAGAKAFAMAAP